MIAHFSRLLLYCLRARASSPAERMGSTAMEKIRTASGHTASAHHGPFAVVSVIFLQNRTCAVLFLLRIVTLAQVTDRSTLHPVFHGIRRFFDNFIHHSPFLSLEPVQDMGNHGLLIMDGVADAQLDAGILLAAQSLFDGFQPIMAAGCALSADPQRPDGQVHIILDDKDLFRGKVVEPGKITDSGTAQIHVCRRFYQDDFFRDPPFQEPGIVSLSPCLRGIPPPGQFVGHHKSDIMTCSRVFRADIAQSNN